MTASKLEVPLALPTQNTSQITQTYKGTSWYFSLLVIVEYYLKCRLQSAGLVDEQREETNT